MFLAFIILSITLFRFPLIKFIKIQYSIEAQISISYILTYDIYLKTRKYINFVGNKAIIPFDGAFFIA